MSKITMIDGRRHSCAAARSQQGAGAAVERSSLLARDKCCCDARSSAHGKSLRTDDQRRQRASANTLASFMTLQMMRITLTITMAIFMAIALLPILPTMATHADRPVALDSARQMILVVTPDWDAVDGVLQRYERGATKQPWRALGEPMAIVVGRNGMAWGKGLHGDEPGKASGRNTAGPIKREGDGRAPAGIFRLSRAFGYAAKEAAGQINFPYVQAVPSLECVDDVKSAYYNRVLDRRSVAKPDWDSAEQMRRKDEFYRWGVIVDHNAQGKRSCGSCIFLHIWAGAGHGTAGCTAMTQANIEDVLRWLRPDAQPILVQLPREQFEQLRPEWKLPEAERQKAKGKS